MSDLFELMAAPMAACVLLTGIHAYLGIHVVERGVIFVDLALAQLAALGATIGFLLGYSLHSTQGYFFALLLTGLGAVILSVTRFKKQRVPQEAIIGIIYAVAGGATILVLNRAPEGAEELRSLLVGHLLYVDWSEVIRISPLYVGVGMLHWVLRHKFIAISRAPEQAEAAGMHVKFWDLLFYLSFGLIVSSSVELAGVLLVFCFLIVPAVCGVLLSCTISGRLIVGWVVSLLTCIAGIWVSYRFDQPTGATIVCAFGVAALACATLGMLRRAADN